MSPSHGVCQWKLLLGSAFTPAVQPKTCSSVSELQRTLKMNHLWEQTLRSSCAQRSCPDQALREMSGGSEVISVQEDATRAGGESGKVGSIAQQGEGPKCSTVSLQSVLRIPSKRKKEFLRAALPSSGAQRRISGVPGLWSPTHPPPCIIRRHHVRAVGECGWGSGSLGCEHRLCGSSVATRGHLMAHDTQGQSF